MFFSIRIRLLDPPRGDILRMAGTLKSKNGEMAVDEANQLAVAFSSIRNFREAKFHLLVAKELKRRNVLARAAAVYISSKLSSLNALNFEHSLSASFGQGWCELFGRNPRAMSVG